MGKKTTAKKRSVKAKQAKKKTVKRTTVKKTTAKKRGAQGKAATQNTWIVTTSPERPIGDVAKDLAKAGLTRHTVLEDIGSIIGSAGDHTIPRLRKIRGVAAVERDTPIDIGPPGSPTTW